MHQALDRRNYIYRLYVSKKEGSPTIENCMYSAVQGVDECA